MNTAKRFAFTMAALVFSMASVMVYLPASANANSYFGGNWKLTFYSPVEFDDESQQVYTVNPDGSDLQLITGDGPQSNPQWSPDMSSRQIAFDQGDEDGGLDRSIYIQDIDSSGAATGSPTVLSGANTCENEWDPSWSPDGSTIAYHRTSEVRDDCSVGSAGGPNHIFTISSSGGTAEARTGGGSGDADFRDTEPTWNKDGDTLVFTRADTEDDSTVIATVPADGDESDVQAIPGSEDGSSPQWSPLTNTVVFRKGGELWTYTIGDSSAQQLTNGASIAFAPTYSPDGLLIASSGNDGIAFYNAENGALLRTTTIDSDSELGFDAADGIHEVDWARADSPPDTEHECTIYVNETCNPDDFDPEIPEQCDAYVSVDTRPEHGDHRTNGSFTPDKNYVGEDNYELGYFDEYMNLIRCIVKITVLPRPPAAGQPNKHNNAVFAGLAAVVALPVAYSLIRRKFARR